MVKIVVEDEIDRHEPATDRMGGVVEDPSREHVCIGDEGDTAIIEMMP
ncbi:hypothetical protein ACFOYU_04095 [Microvirga sp. GCM10011540]